MVLLGWSDKANSELFVNNKKSSLLFRSDNQVHRKRESDSVNTNCLTFLTYNKILHSVVSFLPNNSSCYFVEIDVTFRLNYTRSEENYHKVCSHIVL